MRKRSRTLITIMLTLAMTLTMTIPAFARSTADPAVRFENHRSFLLGHTTAALCKLPTDLDPTPTAEDLNLDPLSYWHVIIPIRCTVDGGDDSGIEKTSRPTAELYQELKQITTEITADKTTVADKYTAISMWVEENIYYKLDNRTNNVYLVYERGYGACSEQSYMEYLMASLSGIKAAVLLSVDHQSTAVMDENGKWFGDAHTAGGHTEPAERAYYTDGLDQYCCNLETGKITKLGTFTDKTPKVRKPKESVPHTDFDDVPADAWYADAVDWAVAKGIANGTSETTFSPLEPCTEAQVLTFLYRAEGSPDCSDVDLYFEPQNNWAVDALKWGSTKEISTTPSKENAGCTRITAITHIWRIFSGEFIKPGNTFTDLDNYPFGEHAVYWAVREDIVTGTSETTFSPDLVCNRATIVTMLYRAYGME